MALYKIWNGPRPTTASQVAVTTGTAIKTMLQVKAVAAIMMKIKAWGVSMDAAAAAAGPQFELIETGTIFGTVTAHVASGCIPWDAQALKVASGTFFAFGTTSTGFTATVEGTIVASRNLDSQFIQPTGERAWEFSLGNEPQIDPVSALRIRVKAAAAVNALCWVLIEV